MKKSVFFTFKRKLEKEKGTTPLRDKKCYIKKNKKNKKIIKEDYNGDFQKNFTLT